MGIIDEKSHDWTLFEVIEKLESLDNELTIYASAEPKWTANSFAVVCAEPEDGSLPLEAVGMKYLLEVSVAKEVIHTWQCWRNEKRPSVNEKCEAIIYYAEYDSYLPV